MALSDFLSFTVAQQVVVRDAVLGTLYYAILLVILLYIVVYNIVMNVGYLTFVTAVGSAHITTQQQTTVVDGTPCDPTAIGCEDLYPSITDLEYCCPIRGGGGAVVDILGNASAPYDKATGTCTWPDGTVALPCEYQDGVGMETVYGQAAFFTTAVHSETQTLNASCSINQSGTTCDKLWDSGSPGYPGNYYFYVAGAETFDVLIQHSVIAGTSTASNQALNNDKMKAAYVYVPQDIGTGAQDSLCARGRGRQDPVADSPEATAAPCYYQPLLYQTYDRIPIVDLLTAAGIGMDSPVNGTKQTYRYVGAKIEVQVMYFNAWRSVSRGNPLITARGQTQGGEDGLHYYYCFKLVDNSPIQDKQVFMAGPFASSRTLLSKHGFFLQPVVTGQLAKPSALAVVLQLTAGLVLLSLANVVVDFLALYVMRSRTFYKRFLIQETDMAQVLRFDTVSDRHIERVLQVRRLPLGGDRVEKIIRLVNDGYRVTDDLRTPSRSAPEFELARQSNPSLATPLSAGGGSMLSALSEDL
mmetsp:Transcript_63096/g.145175  ORF Transcript_63096/g.145175 Transcript_63096/m.145175 type:complete len:527 (-) Transcript_63096:52-1632(-)|eukprot:CAMPEP_0204339356 /NCGR_PEP_ID=MMETSP0469-20131031/21743_1 /ASSEMBLY_ACC=CAM_ASM_000384 /TAXON_ID=2969 /ORGANISM="Oxyrrhis marina" /LENGTH=526 /DNA_ID=CAMNT_0051323697 /DNA_START=34 /DNA_END=1614 /DNA_ORIENTATION=+